jgi:ATP-binding cassette subfamily F protein 3
VQGHLGKFGFSGDEAQRKADTLSGGERARVALAMMVLSRANFLLLDAPTNHLDVESIAALEDALASYEGTILLVSHDRALLRALTTRVWVLHEKHVTDYPGSFAEWEEVAKEREHAALVRLREEEELRRLREKQTSRRAVAAMKTNPDKATKKAARGKIEAVEKEIDRLEAEVAELRRQLENPELYLTTERVRRAANMGKELERLEKQLDLQFGRWEIEAALFEAT